MKLKKLPVLTLVAIIGLTGCLDDDEKVNRTRDGGGAIVDSNPQVASASFAQCGAQITDITLNQSGTISLPANMIDAEGNVTESDDLPTLQATVGFVLRNDGGNVRVTANLVGDRQLSAESTSVAVNMDGGNAVLNFPLDSIARSSATTLNFTSISATATHTRPDNEVFGPCEGSRGVNLTIEVPEPVMEEAQ